MIALGRWTLGGDAVTRLREREAMFVAVRWLVVVFALVAAAADDGRWAWVAWGMPGFLVGANVAATVLPRRFGSAASLRTLGGVVTVADGAAVIASMFNYAGNADTSTGLILVLVVLEAALRFDLWGGIAGGVLAAGVSQLWMLHRDVEFDIAYSVSTAGARSGVYALVGLLVGVLMWQLERAAGQVAAQLRRTDVVGRFAIGAPRLRVDEAAGRLAAILHDDLEFEFAAVVVVDEDGGETFRLVATAGYEDVDVDRFAHFPVTVGIVGRCFRTGRSQLLVDVAGDPDYLEVDPRTRSEMTVPLRARGMVFGAIDVGSSRLAAFDEEDRRFLETIAAQLALAFDNTRLAEIERRTIEELERISVMKDDFIAIANHELRTPVTTIAGFAQSLLKQRDVMTQDEIDDAIERIARQSAHLRDLIEDLLAVPGAAGRRALEPEPVRLSEVAEEVVRALDPRNGVHALSVDVGPDLPEVEADRSAVRRVLTNLVGNAVKYSPGGGAVTVAGLLDGPMVRIDVADEGAGIDPAELSRLFTKFGKAADGGGMGLGLFIVKELVEEMGGDVGVESEPGRGSRFWFRLPAVREAIPA